MSTLNALDPTPEQIKAFLAHKKAGEPVYMLNLLKFKDRATYKDGEDISGRDAYARYAKALSAICLLYTSPSPRDATLSRMPSSA